MQTHGKLAGQGEPDQGVTTTEREDAPGELREQAQHAQDKSELDTDT